MFVGLCSRSAPADISIYKSEGWASTLLMIGQGILIGRSYWLVEGTGGGPKEET